MFHLTIGLLPWLAITVFLVTPFVQTGHQIYGIGFGVACAAVFLMLAPFVSLSEGNRLHRVCALVMIGLSLILVVVAIKAEGVIAMLSGPASPIFMALGILAWCDSILTQSIRAERWKFRAKIISAVFALLVVVIGPLLIGLPILYLLNR